MSTYGSCHGHDYMIVGFTSTYGTAVMKSPMVDHGHDDSR